MRSAPLTPMSLSWSLSVDIDLLWIRVAAMHLAPMHPMLFFLMLFRQMPMSNVSMDVLALKSFRIPLRPLSEIMLEARFRFLQQLDATRLFTACMPASDIALSAMLIVSSLITRGIPASAWRVCTRIQ